MNKEKHVTTKAGVTRSKKLRLSLVPGALIRFAARRHEYGISKGHAEGNWKLGRGDEETRATTIDHLYHHLLKYKDEGGTDQLEAIACNVGMLCDYEEHMPFHPLSRPPSVGNTTTEGDPEVSPWEE